MLGTMSIYVIEQKDDITRHAKDADEEQPPPRQQQAQTLTQQATSSEKSLRTSYLESGYLSPIDVLSPAETAEALERLHEWSSSTFPDGRVTGNMRFKPHLHLPFVSRIAHHPAIVSTVCEALDTSNLLLWSSDFNIKLPNTGGYFSMHQDSTYTGLHPPDLGCTVWVALSDPVDERRGCMTYLAGSHLCGQLPHVEGCGRSSPGATSSSTAIKMRNAMDPATPADGENMLSRGKYVDEAILADALQQRQKQRGGDGSGSSGVPVAVGASVPVPLRGGQASMHHFHLLHRSGPNRGDAKRVGLALRYIDASVRQTGRTRELVTLVSGTTVHDGFDLEPILPWRSLSRHSSAEVGDEEMEELIQRGLKVHAEAMRRESANYFDGASGNITEYDANGVGDE